MSAAGWVFDGVRPPIGPVVITVVKPGASREQILHPPRIDRTREAWHSPSGFEWGYGGSGPAELARAILMAARPGDRPAEGVRHPGCYQRFKFDVVASLPRDGWVVSGDRIEEWLAQYQAANGD